MVFDRACEAQREELCRSGRTRTPKPTEQGAKSSKAIFKRSPRVTLAIYNGLVFRYGVRFIIGPCSRYGIGRVQPVILRTLNDRVDLVVDEIAHVCVLVWPEPTPCAIGEVVQYHDGLRIDLNGDADLQKWIACPWRPPSASQKFRAHLPHPQFRSSQFTALGGESSPAPDITLVHILVVGVAARCRMIKQWLVSAGRSDTDEQYNFVTGYWRA